MAASRHLIEIAFELFELKWVLIEHPLNVLESLIEKSIEGEQRLSRTCRGRLWLIFAGLLLIHS